jgi:DNA-binding XRE family transcriptional regulator
MSRDKEYDTLREEILQNSGRQFGMVSFAITVTVALIGFGLENANPFIFLVPLLVLALVLIHLIRSIDSIHRIASYIRMFIEYDEDDLKWETYICQFRKEARSRKHSTHIRHTLPSYELMLSATGWVCISLSFAYANDQERIVPFALAFLWARFSYVIRRWIEHETSGKLERDLDGVWADVAQKNGKVGLRAARWRAALTQLALAERVGVSPIMVDSWEREGTKPSSAEVRAKVAEVLGVDPWAEDDAEAES